MPRTPWRKIPHPIIDNAIHLYRALLRECTYLPDPAARLALSRHISSRFREHHPPPPGRSQGYRPLPPKRRVQAIAKARRAFSLLFRANIGERPSLLKVLRFTYGRLGRPRRELVRQLQLSPSHDVRDLPSKKAVPASRDLKAWPVLPPKLKALATSQMRQQMRQQLVTRRAPIKRLTPKIGLNSWGRRMPKVREKNIRWGLYRDVLNGVLPPLPEEEWCRLRDLAEGITRWDGPVARRARSSRTDAPSTLLTPSFLETRLSRQRYQITLQNARERFAARTMQRLWAHVFAQCPVMRWDREAATWQVEWGQFPSMGKPVQMPTRPAEMHIFGGVDPNGKVASRTPYRPRMGQDPDLKLPGPRRKRTYFRDDDPISEVTTRPKSQAIPKTT